MAIVVLAVAMLRGLWIGAVREAFSLAAVAAAFIAIGLLTDPVAAWIHSAAPVALSPLASRIAAAVGVGLLTAIAVGQLGGLIRRGIRAAGLGLLDRIGGGALGALEGAVIVSVALALATAGLGHDHPSLAGTRSLATFDAARELVHREGATDVAAPPPGHGS
jgi:uncharacterized membrane protein required for colicin V production